MTGPCRGSGGRLPGVLLLLAGCQFQTEDGDPSPPVSTWYQDLDRDGYGAAAASVEAVTCPEGHVDNPHDCDDLCADAHPGASEICDERDNDCDGGVDEADDVVDRTAWYRDEDGDGWGQGEVPWYDCVRPDGYVDRTGDCDDTEPLAYPGAVDPCGDGLDADCDGRESCHFRGDLTFDQADAVYATDVRGDGFGSSLAAVGDVAGDDHPDIAVGAPGQAEGAVWILLGDVAGFGVPLTLEGEVDGDELGYAVAGVGDADGDGRSDVLAGAPGADDDLGRAWFLPGPLDGAVSLRTVSGARSLDGTVARGRLGEGLAGLEDAAPDGSADLAVSDRPVAADTRLSFFGGANLFPTPGTPDFVRTFDGAGEQWPVEVVSADLFGDGVPWLLAGDAEAGDDAGLVSVMDPSTGVPLVDLPGAEASHTGAFVGLVDGLVDGAGPLVVVGAPNVGDDAGVLLLVPSPPTGTMTLDEVAVARVEGAEEEAVGGTVALPGDLTGDGIPDLALGVPYDDRVLVFHGPIAGTVSTLAADCEISGEMGSSFGRVLTGPGDANGDGYRDLVVGAPMGSSVYLFAGGSSWEDW